MTDVAFTEVLMEHANALKRYGLKFNPFPPAATGIAFADDLWLPQSWAQELESAYTTLSSGQGPKATTVVGAYGSGKTYVLHWMMENQFRPNRVQPYYIGNPGLAFYTLADELLRQIGRYEFSKAVWQALSSEHRMFAQQSSYVESPFHLWLESLNSKASKDDAQRRLAMALQNLELTDEEEVSFRFAQIIVGTRDRPYFTFRDFLPRSATSLVAENQEARYFKALIRILQFAYGLDGIAFLLDEFEDVALGKRLARRQSHEYSSTLRRLLDIAHEERFWLALSITQEGLDQTRVLEPALLDRFGAKFEIQPLSDEEAYDLVFHRLLNAIEDDRGGPLWPFNDGALNALKSINRSNPRTLIKVFWRALAVAAQENVDPPIADTYLTDAERDL